MRTAAAGKFPRTRNGANDPTRTRLLEAAGQVFADEGYHWAKIRDICSVANANVAAINYHFGGKLGLYSEVLRYSIAAIGGPEIDTPHTAIHPEQLLRAFIRNILESVFSEARPVWHVKLMLQEMAQPTPALEIIVRQLIRPKYRTLCNVVGSVLGQRPNARITQLCAHSVVGQVRHYLIARDVIGKVWPDFRFDSASLDEVADHITRFSLAGMRATRDNQRASKRSSRRLSKPHT